MSDHAKEWKEWRNAHDMSQATLARVLGLALRTVQGIESGEHKPSYTSKLRFKELRRRHQESSNEPSATPAACH